MKTARLLLVIIGLFAAPGGTLAFKISGAYGSIIYATASGCFRATKSVEASTTASGIPKHYVTFVYNQPACLYTYTFFQQ